MKVETETFRLKTSNWRFKVRSEGRRMKIYIKLSKEESGRWTAVKNAIIGEGGAVSDDEFAKIILFRGLNAFMDDVNEAIDEMDESEKQALLDEAGVSETVELDIPVTKEEQHENIDEADEDAGEATEPATQEQED
jgi:hypothetical protein|tara:strand:+ start:17157 stop:17564 length:408 start_codon:yes stop_codon:yes gene_type:complete